LQDESIFVEMPTTLEYLGISGVAKITQGFDYILAPPSRVLISQQTLRRGFWYLNRPSAVGLNP
jgi:hypothetical protein